MNRRSFLTTGALAAAAAASPMSSSVVSATPTRLSSDDPFNLAYAPHLGMFRQSAGQDPLDQLRFMAERGFRAFEDNGMKGRDLTLQEGMARVMAEHDITMGVFVAHTIFWRQPNLASGRQDWRDQFLQEITESVEVAKRVNATWMTVVPGHVDLRLDAGYQMANVVESLRRACDILEPHGLVMVLEPLNKRDHPGLFLTDIAQAFAVCRAVDSPSCKILNDLYHQQITEGNLIPNIDAAWHEIAYFQVGDNPGRKEPTTGEINYLNVFRHIHEKGFAGVIGMEHGNANPGVEGEEALIRAYREVDAF
ncbi:MAG: TIM barrel protein [Rhodothermales bacterium]|nr:TIM barrel protein [Rhodothermales bacterium]MBO6780130.1 TIM barrel protein [Rhodothermales bacterium]